MRTSLVVVMLVYYEVAVLPNEYELNLNLAVLYSH